MASSPANSPSSPPRAVVIVVESAAEFTELARFVRVLTGQPGLFPVVVMAGAPYAGRGAHAARLSAAGVHVQTLDGGNVEARDVHVSPVGVRAGTMNAVRRLVRRVAVLRDFAGRFARPRFKAALQAQLAAWHELLERMRPVLVVAAEEYPGSAGSLLFRAAHGLGIAALIVPFTIPNRRETLESLADAPAHDASGGSNRRLAETQPHWAARFRGKPLVRLPAHLAEPIIELGLDSPDPWLCNRGIADAIAVESATMRALYLAAGFPPAQLSLTGGLADDDLARALGERQALREALAVEGAMDAARPWVVMAVPPEQYSAGRRAVGFPRYDDLRDFLVAAAGRLAAHACVVVKLHPRMPAHEGQAFVQPGVVVSERDTAELVAVADLYIASISATIRWAIACGTPVLNFDTYAYAYGDYDDAPGVQTFEDADAFLERAVELVTQPRALEELASRQAGVSGNWGLVDGGNAERMRALVDRLAGTVGQARELSA